MSETRFTPGPWHPGHLGTDSKCQCANVVDEGYAGGICSIHVDNGKRIGEGGNGAPPKDEAVANMHLIAAAPEMHDALAPFADIDGEGDEDFPDDTPVTVKFGRTTDFTLTIGDFRRARRVLSKARGERS